MCVGVFASGCTTLRFCVSRLLHLSFDLCILITRRRALMHASDGWEGEKGSWVENIQHPIWHSMCSINSCQFHCLFWLENAQLRRVLLWASQGRKAYISTCPCSPVSSPGRLQVGVLHHVIFCTTFYSKPEMIFYMLFIFRQSYLVRLIEF